MIEDCRAGRREGWEHLVTQILPAFSRLLEHYAPARAKDARFLGGFLTALRDEPGSPLHAEGLCTEREFVYGARDLLLAHARAGVPAPVQHPRFGAFRSALEPFSVLEKQIAWLETMGYGPEETGRLTQVFPETVVMTRERAAAALSGVIEGLSPESSGPALQAAARAVAPERPLPLRTFLHVLDGRLTWEDRGALESALNASWHEIDRFCRVREAGAAVRSAAPLTAAEATEYLSFLGFARPKSGLWKRLISH